MKWIPVGLLNAAVKTFALSYNFFVKYLATSCVGSVVNVKIAVNLQDIITKCVGYLLRLKEMCIKLVTWNKSIDTHCHFTYCTIFYILVTIDI